MSLQLFRPIPTDGVSAVQYDHSSIGPTVRIKEPVCNSRTRIWLSRWSNAFQRHKRSCLRRLKAELTEILYAFVRTGYMVSPLVCVYQMQTLAQHTFFPYNVLYVNLSFRESYSDLATKLLLLRIFEYISLGGWMRKVNTIAHCSTSTEGPKNFCFQNVMRLFDVGIISNCDDEFISPV